eukprot:m.260318 g.260318  ORF g.260318 m.260318 type:complete len:380 (+) comp39664_c0_seq1:43-1182(+)
MELKNFLLVVGVVCLSHLVSCEIPSISADNNDITLTAGDVVFNGLAGAVSNQRISKVISDIATTKGDLTSVNQRLTDSELNVLSALKTSSNLNVSITALINDVVNNLDQKTQSHIKDLDADISQLKQELTGADGEAGTKIDDLQNQLNQINVSFANKIAALNGKIDDLTSQLKPKLPRSVFFYDFETIIANGEPVALSDNVYVHFTNPGNFGAPGDVQVPPFTLTSASADSSCGGNKGGVFNPPANDVALFTDSESTNNHVLFTQCAGIVQTTLDLILTKKLKFNITASVGGGNGGVDGGYDISFWTAESLKKINTVRAGENGMLDTANDRKYKDINYQFDTSAIPDRSVGEKVTLKFMQSKNGQAHLHYIHVRVSIEE